MENFHPPGEGNFAGASALTAFVLCLVCLFAAIPTAESRFTGGTTPVVSYPVSIHDYSANLDVEWETNPPPLAQVVFTGPAGSGLTNSAATARYDWGDGCMFATTDVTVPPVPPDSTSHVLTEFIAWSDVINLTIGCTDLQGRHFVVFYQKP